MPYYVYILASRRNGTLYTGVTNDLIRRVWEHRGGVGSKFTSKHRVHLLVWFEAHDDVRLALQREKNIKHWLRAWKIALIEMSNPGWRDLFDEIAAGGG